MGKGWVFLAGLTTVLATAGADGPVAVPADFKILVGSYRLSKEPVSTEEIVAREGRVYVFSSATKEVVIVEPNRGRLELLDLSRRVQTEIPFRTLDEALIKIKATLRETVEDRIKKGGRANAVEAEMTRDLFETKMTIAPGSKTNRVRLTNPSIEVDAEGEPDTDASRLSLVGITLESIAKLGAFRTPNDLPPFAELQAIAALTGDRKLRPTELVYLYRLTGPPRKFRRTYRLAPALTDRDVEAIARIDRLREVVPNVRYERYRPDR